MIIIKVFERENRANCSKMAESKETKRKNGKLSLYPLKFEEAVKYLLKIKAETKVKDIASETIKAKEGGK